MVYIFQYYESIINQIDRLQDDNIHKQDIHNNIDKENERILEFLRSYYYSEKSEDEILYFFSKLLNRLEFYKSTLEESIDDICKKILLGFTIYEYLYENCNRLYFAVFTLIDVLLKEFKIPHENADKLQVYCKRNMVTREYLEEVRYNLYKLLDANENIPEEMVDRYGLSSSDILEYEFQIFDKEYELGQKVMDVFKSNDKLGIDRYIKEYIEKYIVNKNFYEAHFYRGVFRFLRGKLMNIQGDLNRERYILAFLIHTSLCYELVEKYLKNNLSNLKYLDDIAGVTDYIDVLDSWLQRIKAESKFQRFNINKDSNLNVKKKVQKIIDKYRADYEASIIGGKSEITEILDIKKLKWKGHPKKFIEALSPLIESKDLSIDGNTDRDKIVETLFDMFIVISKRTKKPLVLDSLITYFKKYPNGEPY